MIFILKSSKYLGEDRCLGSRKHLLRRPLGVQTPPQEIKTPLVSHISMVDFPETKHSTFCSIDIFIRLIMSICINIYIYILYIVYSMKINCIHIYITLQICIFYQSLGSFLRRQAFRDVHLLVEQNFTQKNLRKKVSVFYNWRVKVF